MLCNDLPLNLFSDLGRISFLLSKTEAVASAFEVYSRYSARLPWRLLLLFSFCWAATGGGPLLHLCHPWPQLGWTWALGPRDSCAYKQLRP